MKIDYKRLGTIKELKKPLKIKSFLLKTNKSFLNIRAEIILKIIKNSIEANKMSLKGGLVAFRRVTNYIFYIFKSFSFDVIVNPSNSPFRNFIFSFPFTRYRLFIKPSNISKFFYSKFAFF